MAPRLITQPHELREIRFLSLKGRVEIWFLNLLLHTPRRSPLFFIFLMKNLQIYLPKGYVVSPAILQQSFVSYKHFSDFLLRQYTFLFYYRQRLSGLKLYSFILIQLSNKFMICTQSALICQRLAFMTQSERALMPFLLVSQLRLNSSLTVIKLRWVVLKLTSASNLCCLKLYQIDTIFQALDCYSCTIFQFWLLISSYSYFDLFLPFYYTTSISLWFQANELLMWSRSPYIFLSLFVAYFLFQSYLCFKLCSSAQMLWICCFSSSAQVKHTKRSAASNFPKLSLSTLLFQKVIVIYAFCTFQTCGYSLYLSSQPQSSTMLAKFLPVADGKFFSSQVS